MRNHCRRWQRTLIEAKVRIAVNLMAVIVMVSVDFCQFIPPNDRCKALT